MVKVPPSKTEASGSGPGHVVNLLENLTDQLYLLVH